MSISRFPNLRLARRCSIVAASLVLASCGQRPGVGDSLTIRFDLSEPAGHLRHVCIDPRPALCAKPAKSSDSRIDIVLEDMGEWIMLRHNGTRNLILVGMGSKEALRQVAASQSWWAIANLGAAARGAGIHISDKGPGYWSPAHLTCVPGMIVATRSRESGAAAQDVGALVLVESIGPDRSVKLVVIQARRAPKG